MFCEKCGAQNPDNVMRCSNCGNELNAEPKTSVKDKIMNSKYFIPAVAAAAALLVIVLFVTLLGGNAKVAPVKRYFKSFATENVDKYLSAFPKKYIEKQEDENDDLEDEIEDLLEMFNEYAEEEYGDRIRIKIKVTDKDKFDEDDLDDLRDRMKSYYDLSKSKITQAWELEVEVTIKGSEDKDTEDTDFIVFKYDGKWYLSPEHMW